MQSGKRKRMHGPGFLILQRRVFASKDSTRPEWSRSSESGRPVESDPRMSGSGPMSEVQLRPVGTRESH